MYISINRHESDEVVHAAAAAAACSSPLSFSSSCTSSSLSSSPRLLLDIALVPPPVPPLPLLPFVLSPPPLPLSCFPASLILAPSIIWCRASLFSTRLLSRMSCPTPISSSSSSSSSMQQLGEYFNTRRLCPALLQDRCSRWMTITCSSSARPN